MQNPILRIAGIGVLLFASASAAAQLGIKIENITSTTTPTYIKVNYHKSLVPQTGMTIEAWITYDESTLATGWRWPTIARQNPNAGKESFWFRIQAGQNKSRVLALGMTTSFGLRSVGYSFIAGEFKKWTHVAGTYDGKVMRIYVNGVLKSTSSSIGPNLRDQGGQLNIGNGDGNVIENWNGELDEIRLWPYARTADEIQSTMNLRLASVPGQVSTWNLDFNAKDSSNKNDGTSVNKVKFQVNTLRLTSAPSIGGIVFGAGTAGCAGTPAAGVSGYAASGNKGFALTCLNAAKLPGSVGFVWVGLGRLASAVKVDGADLWVNMTAGLLVPVRGDSNRLIKIPVALPVLPVGTTVHCQYFFHETNCNVPILASEGLTIKIQK